MRIGINGSGLIAGGAPLGRIVEHAAAAEADGFATYWLAQLGVPDALTAIAAMGSATSTIELGTAVVPTWPRHPLMLAAQALTVQQAIGDRLALGIGLAHKMTVEATFRVPFATPAKHMREYLSVLLPALQERAVSFEGDIWSGIAPGLGGPDVPAPRVLLAAMGPQLLAQAGARTDGTILWLAGPRAIADVVKPALDAAAAEAGRPAPRIVASVPVCVTADADAVRGVIDAVLAGYDALPSYKGMLEAQGASRISDVAIVGDEDAVQAGLDAMAAAGVTDFSALELGTNESETAATRELLADRARVAGSAG